MGKNSGGIYINNGTTSKHIPTNELDVYIQQGWSIGIVKRNTSSTKGRKMIHKDGKRKFVKPEELSLYLSQGWTTEVPQYIKDIISKTNTGNKYSVGRKLSEETKKKISEAGKGRIVSEETRKKKSESMKSKNTSPEFREAVSKARKGIKFSEEHKKNLSIAAKNRPQMTEEQIAIQQRKAIETKRKNGTLNTSKLEEEYYRYLLTMYDESDIIRQYKEDRYPFFCDFYIKSEDKFIECNFHWTHGGHPFNPQNKEDMEILEKAILKSETSDFMKVFIDVWTRRDVQKQRVAKDNNLNYEVIYNV